MKERPLRREGDAERDLRTWGERAARLLDSVPDMVWATCPRGRLRYVNRAVHRVLGLDPADALGMTPDQYLSAASYRTLVQWLTDALKAGPPGQCCSGELDFIHRDGHLVACEVQVAIDRDAAGDLRGYEGVTRDVRPRRSVEASLRRSEERYRDLVENLNDIVYETDAGGVITYISPNVVSLGGYRQEEVIGQSFTRFVHPEDLQDRLERLARVLEGDPSVSEYRMLTRDGGVEWILTKAQPVISDGRVEGVRGVLVNISERKRAEEEIRRHRDHLQEIVDERTRELRAANERLRSEVEERRLAEERVRLLNEELEERVLARTAELELALAELKKMDAMKDTFLSTVSHELRTPLTSIQSFSEILLAYDHDPQTRREFLGIINSESQRLTRLINDVLDLSKIQAGQMVWRDELIALQEVAADAVRTQRQVLEEKDLRVDLAFPDGLPPVRADRDRILQVVTNLLSNAAKFSHRGGEIRIRLQPFEGRRAREPGDWLRLSVEDDGEGIEPRDHETIFERFRQSSVDTLADKPKGTGLGLAICRDIVGHYGGNIWVESEKGRGSTFLVSLPVAAEQERGRARRVPAPEPDDHPDPSPTQ